MSNRAGITFTEFVSLDDALEPTGESYVGFRIFDDYSMSYSTIGTKEEMSQALEELEGAPAVRAIKLAMKHDNEEISYLLDSIMENETGIYVNGNWHSWEEIQAAFEEAEE